MIPKNNRLTRAHVRSVLSRGTKKHSDAACVIFVEKFSNEHSRFSAIVGKQLAKSAVARNRLRRAIYQGIGNAWEFIPSNMHSIVMARQGLMKKTPQEITIYIESLLQKIFSTQ